MINPYQQQQAPQPQQQQQPRQIPQSELDLLFKTTESTWGKYEIPQQLKERLTKIYSLRNKETNEKFDIKDELWSLLSFYTRDLRLSNLSYSQNEIQYCQWYLDFAEDMLQEGYLIPFITALSRVISVLELAQSKNGFFRRNQNTLIQEQTLRELEPPKKNLLGLSMGKKQQQSY